jgi:hypothetical protein
MSPYYSEICAYLPAFGEPARGRTMRDSEIDPAYSRQARESRVRPALIQTPPRHSVAPPSLHAPLLLRLLARGLILELLPFLCRLVILPMDHMRVNFLRRAYRPMPQARGHRRQPVPLASRCELCASRESMEARAHRQFQPPEQQRHRSLGASHRLGYSRRSAGSPVTSRLPGGNPMTVTFPRIVDYALV